MTPDVARNGGSVEIRYAYVMLGSGGLGNLGGLRTDPQRNPDTVIWRNRDESRILLGLELVGEFDHGSIDDPNHRRRRRGFRVSELTNRNKLCKNLMHTGLKTNGNWSCRYTRYLG